jgi:hypothetical protein
MGNRVPLVLFSRGILTCLGNYSHFSSMTSNMYLPTASHKVVDVGFPRKSLLIFTPDRNPYVCISTPPFSQRDSIVLSMSSATHNPYVCVLTPTALQPHPVQDLTPTSTHSKSSSLVDIQQAAAASLPARFA